jgi:hypothetical protein
MKKEGKKILFNGYSTRWALTPFGILVIDQEPTDPYPWGT